MLFLCKVMYLVSIRREGRLLVGRDFWQIILSNNRFLNKTLNWFAPPVFIISLLMQNGLWMQFQHVHPNTYIRSDYPMLLLTNGSIFTTLYLIFETLWIITPCSYPISWMFSFFNSIVRLLVCGLSILSSKSKHGLKDLQHYLYLHHYIFLMAHVYDMTQFMTCENISKT